MTTNKPLLAPVEPDAQNNKSESDRIADTISNPSDAPKRRGRPPGSTNKNSATKPRVTKTKKANAEAIYDRAVGANDVFLAAVELVGGEDAAASKDERKKLDDALARFMEENPDFQMSPFWQMATAYGTFGLIKLAQPSVGERAKLGLSFAKMKIVGGFNAVTSTISRFFHRKKTK